MESLEVNKQEQQESQPNVNVQLTQIQIPRIHIICLTHNLPIISIQSNSLTPLCESCIKQLAKVDVQIQRIKATALFKSFVEQFKKDNEQIQKNINRFKQSNINEVRRRIKKSLPQIQGKIKYSLQIKMLQTNNRIRQFIEEEFREWEFLNSQRISEAHHINMLLNYKQYFENMREKIIELKKKMKKEIADQIKKVVHQHYQKQFDL